MEGEFRSSAAIRAACFVAIFLAVVLIGGGLGAWYLFAPQAFQIQPGPVYVEVVPGFTEEPKPGN